MGSQLLWSFPLLMAASVVIGWAAEITAERLSAGIALAVLAWLQCAPEFAVEASIAWHQDSSLALANLTGSLRLLLGLGWPMVFFIHAAWGARREKDGRSRTEIALPESFAVEAVGLAVPILYFVFILAKASFSVFDGAVLCGLYFFYFWMLLRARSRAQATASHSAAETGALVAKILSLTRREQNIAATLFFAIGGAALLVTTAPFVEGLKAAALAFGVSQYAFIQWVAPIASEFPEKVTAFNWARKPRKAPMAIVNLLSSVTSQWTLLAGLVPILFSISAGRLYVIPLSEFQRAELLLTIAQSALAVLFLADLKIKRHEAIGLFVLWLLQLFLPNQHALIAYAYLVWLFLESWRLALQPKQLVAWTRILRLFSSSP